MTSATVGGALVVEADQAAEVHARGEQQRARGETVAPAAAGLLVVGLEAGGQGPVGDGAYGVGVDAHAEGVGGDDHLGSAGHEGLLAATAGVGGHAGVIGDGGDAGAGDELGDGVGVAAGAAVDDRGAGLERVLRGEDVQEGGALARDGAGSLQGEDVEGEVGAVEAGAHGDGLAQTEARGDLLRDAGGGGGGGGHHGGAAEGRDGVVQAQVVGAEVVAPLGDAVGLVDDEEGDAALGEGVAEGGGGEALGGGEDERGLAGGDRAQRGGVVPVGHAGGEHRGGHAGVVQAARLVGHQGDERRDDDDEAVAGERGQLIAERLAAAGGHHDERVASVQGGEHGLALAGPEGAEAEPPQQRLGGVHQEEVTHRFGGDLPGG